MADQLPPTVFMSSDMLRWLSILLLWPVALLAQDQAVTRIVTGQEVQQAIIERLASAGEVAAPNVMAEKQFYACDAPLEVEQAFSGWRSVTVRCPSPVEWSIALRAQVLGAVPHVPQASEAYVTQAVFLRRPLRSGDRIQEGDLELRPIDPLSVSSVYIAIEDVAGRVLSQSLTPRVPVSPRHLQRNWAVNTDDIVTLQIVNGGIEIESPGIALEPGQIGDIILLRNLSSGSEVTGRISQERKVQVLSKMAP